MLNISKSALGAALLALAACLPAHAGLLDDDEARKAILDLRAKVDVITRELNARIDTKLDKTGTLEFLNQHEQTMQEIAKLRGQLEVLANELAVAQRRQKDLFADLDNRLRKLEPRPATIDGKVVMIDPNEQKSYDAAIVLFKAGDYKGAAASLTEFARRYPESGFAANAQYWLGNAYYAQRDCTNAIATQQLVIANYPDSPKTPDSMLNIASCHVELKDKKNAKKVLLELVAKYPESTAATAARERLLSLK